MFYWILLGLAITAETADTLSMRQIDVGRDNSGSILMLVMIALSYTSLSFTVGKIALSVTYALWEGIGILFTTLFSMLLFNEALSAVKVAGLVSLVLDIVLIKSDIRKPTRMNKKAIHAAT